MMMENNFGITAAPNININNNNNKNDHDSNDIIEQQIGVIYFELLRKVKCLDFGKDLMLNMTKEMLEKQLANVRIIRQDLDDFWKQIGTETKFQSKFTKRVIDLSARLERIALVIELYLQRKSTTPIIIDHLNNVNIVSEMFPFDIQQPSREQITESCNGNLLNHADNNDPIVDHFDQQQTIDQSNLIGSKTSIIASTSSINQQEASGYDSNVSNIDGDKFYSPMEIQGQTSIDPVSDNNDTDDDQSVTLERDMESFRRDAEFTEGSMNTTVPGTPYSKSSGCGQEMGTRNEISNDDEIFDLNEIFDDASDQINEHEIGAEAKSNDNPGGHENNDVFGPKSCPTLCDLVHTTIGELTKRNYEENFQRFVAETSIVVHERMISFDKRIVHYLLDQILSKYDAENGDLSLYAKFLIDLNHYYEQRQEIHTIKSGNILLNEVDNSFKSILLDRLKYLYRMKLYSNVESDDDGGGGGEDGNGNRIDQNKVLQGTTNTPRTASKIIKSSLFARLFMANMEKPKSEWRRKYSANLSLIYELYEMEFIDRYFIRDCLNHILYKRLSLARSDTSIQNLDLTSSGEQYGEDAQQQDYHKCVYDFLAKIQPCLNEIMLAMRIEMKHYHHLSVRLKKFLKSLPPPMIQDDFTFTTMVTEMLDLMNGNGGLQHQPNHHQHVSL